MIQREGRTYKVFIDFDGTITTKDVGEEFILKFGDKVKAYEIIKLWLDGEITSIQTWERLCETVKNPDLAEVDKFIEGIEIDPYLHEFIEYCNEKDIEIVVLSDGLDYYIDKIMKKNNLDKLKVYSNHVEFENGKCIPTFPYTDEECKLCANCKRNHVINHSSDDDFTIYIGDGYSDACPVQYVDFVFAKKSLLKYCEKNRITYFPFRDFSDVLKRVDELINKKKLKKRHQAVLKRLEVYKQG